MDAASHPVPRFLFARRAFARLTAMVRRGRQRRIEHEELLALDDRELRDVGLTRLDAKILARKSFWRT